MPIYVYRCEKCGQQFERAERLAEQDSPAPRCPHCGHDRVARTLAPFYAHTAKKS